MKWHSSLWALVASALLIVTDALAAGQPDKVYLESKFHVMYTGLRSPDMSRVTGNELHRESSRDVRLIPGVLRYTQSFPLPLYDLRSSFDSITEFYADDLDHMKAAFATPAGKASIPWLLRYTGGGMGEGARPWRPVSAGPVIVRDHVIVDGHEQGYKWFNFMRRRQGVTKEAADTYLRERYAPALASLPGIRRYVLGLTYEVQDGEPPNVWNRPALWDAVDMIWFDSLDDMMRLLGSIDYQENVLRVAERDVIDQAQSISFGTIYRETVPFPPRYEGPRWEEIQPVPVGSNTH